MSASHSSAATSVSSLIPQQVFRDQLLDRRRRLLRFAVPAPAPVAPPPAVHHDVQRLLTEVDAALERLDAGTFGVCEVCRESVETSRLLADPCCRICLDHYAPEQLRALEDDLEMAGRVQTSLLPQRDLEFDGWQVHSRYVPLGPVSGDYYDVVHERPGQSLFLFGDVEGKGVAASLLMSHLHAMFRSLSAEGLPLCDMVARANRIFAGSTGGSAYATLLCGRLDGDGALELVNAGHPPAVLRTANGVETLGGTGLPVGLFGGGDYTMVSRRLARGDVLVLYTDGVSEARDPGDREFGAERVAAAVDRARGASAAGVVEAVLADLDGFRGRGPLSDDVTVLAVRRTA
jgi:sigma-B regulation protein RsbU (phosphoserine phosphatase)